MGFEVVMVTAIRPWQDYNLKIVPHSMLPKWLGAEATKSTRLILCSALCLSSADSASVSSNRKSLSAWRLALCCSSFPHKVGGGQSPWAGRRTSRERVRERITLKEGAASVGVPSVPHAPQVLPGDTVSQEGFHCPCKLNQLSSRD